MLGPNFVSGQWKTCNLLSAGRNDCQWSYVRRGNYVITAGRPEGPDSQRALATFYHWCEEEGVAPLIFGCEPSDLTLLREWELTEIGRQPLFFASPSYDPGLAGKDQPPSHRKLRRQARRALSKGVIVEEFDVTELWELSEKGAFDPMLLQRWKRRGLDDFTFLVEFRMERGQRERRNFIARRSGSSVPLALAFLVPSKRGWLLEHQILSPDAPNGTAELLLCHLLSNYLEPSAVLSLGITPLFRELKLPDDETDEPGILEFVPKRFRSRLIESWESFYGFRSLVHFRTKLEPDEWEPVYWAVPQRRVFRDILSVLRAFAGGPLAKFALNSLNKRLHRFALRIRQNWLVKLNLFYVVTLFFWIPILWHIDGEPLFGNAEACKVWAVYDVFLLALFVLHHRIIQSGKANFATDLLLGLVAADSLLAWIQTVLFHGGLPTIQPLGALIFILNTAPLSALLFLILVKYATKAVPLQRREEP